MYMFVLVLYSYVFEWCICMSQAASLDHTYKKIKEGMGVISSGGCLRERGGEITINSGSYPLFHSQFLCCGLQSAAGCWEIQDPHLGGMAN